MKKKQIIAMILAGGQGSRLLDLTEKIAKPGVPFGGKYRIIDFTLSNCSNSGIDTVGVLTQYEPHILNDHIGRGSPWDLDRMDGGVTVLQPHTKKNDEGGWYKGTANAIYQNIQFIDKYDPENVLILSGDIIGTTTLTGPEKYKSLYQQNHHMLVAQAKAMALCHEMVEGGKIGPAPNISLAYPASCKPEDQLAAQNLNAIRNWLYLDMAVYGEYNHLAWAFMEKRNATPHIEEGDMEILKNGHPDFIGFNYYSTATVAWCDENQEETFGHDQQKTRMEEGVYLGASNPNLPHTDFGWEIDPFGFRATIREMYSRYRLPMIVTENGLGAYDKLTEDGKVHDPYRIEYLRKHIEQIQLAITDGAEMMGYCPWSAIDLISTHEGMVKRYGFIYVDRDEFDLKTLDRYRKDSFYWYKKVIASNGEDLSD